MRTAVTVIALAALLGAGATPQQRQDQMLARLESMGVICHAAVFTPRTPEIHYAMMAPQPAPGIAASRPGIFLSVEG